MASDFQSTSEFLKAAGSKPILGNKHVDLNETSVPTLPGGINYTTPVDYAGLTCPCCGAIVSDISVKNETLTVPPFLASQLPTTVGFRYRLESCGHEAHAEWVGRWRAEVERRKQGLQPQQIQGLSGSLKTLLRVENEGKSQSLFALRNKIPEPEAKAVLDKHLIWQAHQRKLIDETAYAAPTDLSTITHKLSFIGGKLEKQPVAGNGYGGNNGYDSNYPMPTGMTSKILPNQMTKEQADAFLAGLDAMTLKKEASAPVQQLGKPFGNAAAIDEIHELQKNADTLTQAIMNMPLSPARTALQTQLTAITTQIQKTMQEMQTKTQLEGLSAANGMQATAPQGYQGFIPKPVKEPAEIEAAPHLEFYQALDENCPTSKSDGKIVLVFAVNGVPHFTWHVLDAVLLAAEKYPDIFNDALQNISGYGPVFASAIEQIEQDILDLKEGRKSHADCWDKPKIVGAILSMATMLLAGIAPKKGKDPREELMVYFKDYGDNVALCRWTGETYVQMITGTFADPAVTQNGPKPQPSNVAENLTKTFHKQFQRKKRIIRRLEE